MKWATYKSSDFIRSRKKKAREDDKAFSPNFNLVSSDVCAVARASKTTARDEDILDVEEAERRLSDSSDRVVPFKRTT